MWKPLWFPSAFFVRLAISVVFPILLFVNEVTSFRTDIPLLLFNKSLKNDH